MQHRAGFGITHGAVLWLFAVGCGGDAGADTQAVKDPSTTEDGDPADGDPGPGEDAGEQVSLRVACETACSAHAECLQLSEALCMEECMAQEAAVPADCHDEAIAEQECLAELSCEEAKAYALEGRRSHAVCGAQAQAYFAACTLGEGSLPSACGELCARYAECEVLGGSVGACEERCTLEATSYDADFGETCSGAFLAFSACAAKAECSEVTELYEDSLAPSSCEAELSAMEGACQ